MCSPRVRVRHSIRIPQPVALIHSSPYDHHKMVSDGCSLKTVTTVPPRRMYVLPPPRYDSPPPGDVVDGSSAIWSTDSNGTPRSAARSSAWIDQPGSNIPSFLSPFPALPPAPASRPLLGLADAEWPSLPAVARSGHTSTPLLPAQSVVRLAPLVGLEGTRRLGPCGRCSVMCRRGADSGTRWLASKLEGNVLPPSVAPESQIAAALFAVVF
jgi:hypothetical protein